MATQLAYRHWTRKEYDRLIELGVIKPDERIELISGQMIVAEPKGSPHSTAVGLTAEALRAAFGPGWVIRVQDAVAIAVTRGAFMPERRSRIAGSSTCSDASSRCTASRSPRHPRVSDGATQAFAP